MQVDPGRGAKPRPAARAGQARRAERSRSARSGRDVSAACTDSRTGSAAWAVVRDTSFAARETGKCEASAYARATAPASGPRAGPHGIAPSPAALAFLALLVEVAAGLTS